MDLVTCLPSTYFLRELLPISILVLKGIQNNITGETVHEIDMLSLAEMLCLKD